MVFPQSEVEFVFCQQSGSWGPLLGKQSGRRQELIPQQHVARF